MQVQINIPNHWWRFIKFVLCMLALMVLFAIPALSQTVLPGVQPLPPALSIPKIQPQPSASPSSQRYANQDVQWVNIDGVPTKVVNGMVDGLTAMHQTTTVAAKQEMDATQAPIEMENCTFHRMPSLTLGSVEIQFTNVSTVAADTIRFQFGDNFSAVYVRDVGKFTPGLTITHRYYGRNFAGIRQNYVWQSSTEQVSPNQTIGEYGFAPRMSCEVQSVHFVDGSFWSNPKRFLPTTVGE